MKKIEQPDVNTINNAIYQRNTRESEREREIRTREGKKRTGSLVCCVYAEKAGESSQPRDGYCTVKRVTPFLVSSHPCVYTGARMPWLYLVSAAKISR